jgi:hypothetical protein
MTAIKVEYVETDNADFSSTVEKKAVIYKWGEAYILRCFYCGECASLDAHRRAGLIHVTNGVVDIRGPGAHSIGNHWTAKGNTACPAHYHIYNGEVVLDCGWKP